MEQSENIIELLTALCAARLEFPAIARNREGFSKRGGQKYGYADLNAIIDATAPSLAHHGLAMMQFLEDGPEAAAATVKSILFHLSGQWISSQLTVIRHNDPQEFGIITTYAKRYMQQAMLNLSTEGEDQDGKLPTEETKKDQRRERAGRPTPDLTPHPPPERQTSAQAVSAPHAPRTIPVGKPTADEVTQLLELMRRAYEDEGVVDQELRRVLQIPIGQEMRPPRVKNTMTRAHLTALQTTATDYVLMHKMPLDDTDDWPVYSGPTDATPPEGAQADNGAGGESPVTDGLHTEAPDAIPHAPETAEPPAFDTEASEPPEVEVTADGLVTTRGVDVLRARAETYKKLDLVAKIQGTAAGLTPGQFRYAWVEVGPKA